MPSRWEVPLMGPRDVPVPLAALQAVVSGWLDDPPRRLGPGSGAGAMAILQVRLLDDGLAGRLARAVRPGRPVRLGAGEYQILGLARETGRAGWAGPRRWPGDRAGQG